MTKSSVAALLLLFGCATPKEAAPPARQPARPARQPAPLDIRTKGDWEHAEYVQKVLDAAASELWRYFPDRTLPPILVEPKGGPITLFARGPGGEIQVRLATATPFWAQVTYQFSHELAHVLCEYDDRAHPNKWFEESICEVASLFVLRRSAETWKVRPPYPHWKDYAPALESYADERIKAHALTTTLAAWYRENADALARDAGDRDRNTIVAVQLLALFEQTPRDWCAVGYLNRGTLDASTSFQQYLQAWYRACPEKHRRFIVAIAKLFDERIDES